MRPASVSTSTSGSSQYAPREPVRTTGHVGHRLRDFRRHLVGTNRARAGVGVARTRAVLTWRPEAGAIRASKRTGVSGAMHPVADAHRRPECAVPEAVHRLEVHTPVGGRLAFPRAERGLGVAHQFAAAHRLAGLGHADLHDVVADRRLAQVAVEAHHAVHLGAREVERLRDHPHRSGRHVADALLHRQERGQQRRRSGVDRAQQVAKRGDFVVCRHGVVTGTVA